MKRDPKTGKLDLTGIRFGRLVAESPADNDKKFTKWLCRCDCGGEKAVRTNQLRTGVTKSCGCLHTEGMKKIYTTHGQTANYKTTVEYRMFAHAKDRAKKLNLPFNLELTDIAIPERCPVFPEMLLSVGVGGPQPNSPSLDRLVPSLGYIKGNIRVISDRANRIKRDATADELFRIAEWLRRELSDKKGE